MRSDCIIFKIEDDVKFLLNETNLSCTKIGKIYNCSRGPIYNIQRKYNITRPENPRRIHMKIPCKWCGKEFYARKQKTRPNRGKFCCKECYRQWQMSEDNKGPNNPGWREDALHEPEEQKIRKSPEWKAWREEVYKRDDYTCQLCGKKGGILHPHHIKQRKYFPDLIFNVDNGITLCSDCHVKEPVHGKDYELQSVFQEIVR